MCKMEFVAKAFDVEMGEEFYLASEGVKHHKCRLTDKGIERFLADWETVKNK